MSDTATGTRPPTPFKELDFFVEEDAWMFAGREREARQLVSRIVNARAIVVHARSGLGKTSLLRAGVIPLLRQQNFRPVYVRTLDSLLGDLAEAVVQDCQLPPPPAEGDPEARARQVIEAAAAGGPLVLVLDQFEEFFTRFERQPRERQAFVQFITGIVRDAQRDVRVVFSLREDYLYALDEFQRKLPDLFTQAFRLLPLTPLGAREAIIRPLVNEKVPYDEALITQLVDELTGFDFDSARLQVTCSEVYRHALAGAHGRVALKAGDLNSLKESAGTGLRGIYKRYLREAVANIPPVLHLETKLLLDKLITAKRTKFATGREALHAEFADAPRVDLVLAALTGQKLVRSETRGGKEWFELRHECLVEEILEWFKEDTTFDSFRFVRGLIEEHSRGGRFRTRPERLLTADQLTALVPLREHLRLAPEQLEYVLQSAVYTQSPDLRTWARIDMESATRLLQTLSATTLTPMRIGALLGLGQLGKIDPELSALCLGLAFDNSVPPGVSEAARKTAAFIATDDDLAKLRGQAVSEDVKPHLRELLADLYVAGRLGNSFSVWQRWLARQNVLHRRCRQFGDQRMAFISRGLMGGLCGGAIFGVAAIIFFYWVRKTVPPDQRVFLILVSFFFLVVGGAFAGWRNGAAAFKSCAMGEKRWWKASLPSMNGATTSAGIHVGVAILLTCFSVYVVPWVMFRALLTGLTFAVEPIVRRRPTPRQRIALASLICLPPAGLTAWLTLVSFPFGSDEQTAVWLLPGLFCLLGIDLCSFSLAIPDKGIKGAAPVNRPAGGDLSKKLPPPLCPSTPPPLPH